MFRVPCYVLREKYMPERNPEQPVDDEIEKEMLNAELIMEKQEFERDWQAKWKQLVEIKARLQVLEIWENEGRVLSPEQKEYLVKKPEEADELWGVLEDMNEGKLNLSQRLKLDSNVAERVSEIIQQEGH